MHVLVAIALLFLRCMQIYVKRGVVGDAGRILTKADDELVPPLLLNQNAIFYVTQALAAQLQNNTDPNSSALLGSTLAAFTIYLNRTSDTLAARLVCIASLIAYSILLSVHCLFRSQPAGTHPTVYRYI